MSVLVHVSYRFSSEPEAEGVVLFLQMWIVLAPGLIENPAAQRVEVGPKGVHSLSVPSQVGVARNALSKRHMGCPTVRGCIVTPPKWTPLPLPHLPILLGPRHIFMFSMSKIVEDMCLSARMPSVDKVEKTQ